MFTDLEFLKVVWFSSTFRELLLSMGIFFAIVLFSAFIFMRVRSKSKLVITESVENKRARFNNVRVSLNRDEAGTANAVDFIMIIPFFIFIMCLFVQMAMIVNASLIVHYAAYSAARTARVHFCNRSVLQYSLGYASCSVSRAEEKALDTARYVLIAASPVNADIPSNGNPPNESLQWLANQYLKRNSPILVQARYAYDSRNVTVNVEPAVSPDVLIDMQFIEERIPDFGSGSNPDTLTDRKLLNAWPVTVNVEYVKHLGVPLVGPLLSNVSRGNNHFRTIEAEITLL